MDFNAPDWEYGGGQPARQKSADGTYFYSALARKGGSTGPLRFVVWHVSAAGALLDTWETSGIVGDGQLCLQGDGTLEAVGYVAFGDNQTIRAVPVPGWKPWPVGAPGPRGLPGPKGDPGPTGPTGPAGGGTSDPRVTKFEAIKAIADS